MKDERKLRLVVAINSLVATTHPAYSNHIQWFFRLGRNYPNIDVCLFNPSRMSIDRMRNAASEITMQEEFDYLLFIDDDVLVPVDALGKLLALDADIAAGDVIIRGYPFNHMLFKYTDSTKTSMLPIKKLSKARGPMSVDAVGFSLCLIKASLLKKVGVPHFITGPTNTEDIYFCLKAKQQVPDCTIMADTSIICGHILWNEIISSDNKAAYSKYYESQFPHEAKALTTKKEQDRRDDKYVAEIKSVKRTA